MTQVTVIAGDALHSRKGKPNPPPHSCGRCRNPFTGGSPDCPNAKPTVAPVTVAKTLPDERNTA